MSNGDSHPQSLWGVIGVCATVAVVSAGAGWAIARAYVSDELEQVQRSKDWHLPANLDAIGQLSRTVALQLQERRELDEARKRLPQLDAGLRGLAQKTTQLEQENKELRARILNLEGDTFELTEGDTRFIVPNELAIGLDDIAFGAHSVRVQFGTKSAVLSPGEPVEMALRGTVYTVTFVRSGASKAVFTVHSQSSTAAPQPSSSAPPKAKKHS